MIVCLVHICSLIVLNMMVADLRLGLKRRRINNEREVYYHDAKCSQLLKHDLRGNDSLDKLKAPYYWSIALLVAMKYACLSYLLMDVISGDKV